MTVSGSFAGDLVPHIVDKRATLTPDTVYSEYPISAEKYEEGYRKITYKQFANAVNGAAWWLLENLGRGEDFETLAYLGPNDLRYSALILGAVKAGYKLFLTSPRNSLVAHKTLFDKLNCRILLSSSPQPPAVKAIHDHQPLLDIKEVPGVSYFLDTQHGHFKFNKSWPDACSEPLFVIHTSGSTGIPKPLIYTHATAAANTKMMALDPPSGYRSQDRLYQGKRVFITFPPFHGAYLVSHLFNAVGFGTVMIAPISGTLPSAQGLVDGLKKTPADVAFLVPSIVNELAGNPSLLDYCAKHLELILYCGGDLPQSIGDAVASKMKLLNQFGASELGLTPQILALDSPEDWKHAQFHPHLGLELRHHSEDLYELYAVRDPDKKDSQPTFTIFRDAQEYGSRDLFVRHRELPDLWDWIARADDIIVFLNGEKTNPISMEQYIITKSKEISAALVVGAQRFQAALLIETTDDSKTVTPAEQAIFIERAWPTIDTANRDAPSHARIMKSHILFTQPHKPLVRAGKGTVSRAASLKSYESEIDTLYRNADSLDLGVQSTTRMARDHLDHNTVAQCVKESVLSIMDWSNLDESVNFFAMGMDSLQALATVRRIRQSLCISVIALSTVYTNPSLSALTSAILRLLDQASNSQASEERLRVKLRNEMIEEYKFALDKRLSSKISRPSFKARGHTVVLTGSSGRLGTYLLDSLLSNLGVTHIYCLNRRNISGIEQSERNRSFHLHSDMARTSFWTADLSKPHLNLPENDYAKLLSKATLIIHNAWSVNFNLPLSSFRTQLDGLVNLLALIRVSREPSRLFYTSSISSVMNLYSGSGKISEIPIATETAPAHNGYAESKYVAEQIIEHAAQMLSPGGSVAFARVGQLAGTVNHEGIWNKDEWFPSMIISSAYLNALPESLGEVFDLIDWVPIDLAAEILGELALSENPSTPNRSEGRHADVYHPLNPHKVHWRNLQATVQEELSTLTKKKIDIVPLHLWISKVREATELLISSKGGSESVDLEAALQVNPAAKLLDFYESLLAPGAGLTSKLDTSETLRLSNSMRRQEPIKDEWMRKWVREWL